MHKDTKYKYLVGYWNPKEQNLADILIPAKMKNILRSLYHNITAIVAHPRLAAFAQPQRLFLTLAIPFGVVFIFLSAPFQVPDEPVHFYRAYAISTGQFTGKTYTLPESVVAFSNTVSKDLAGNDQNKQSKKALYEEVFRRFETQPATNVTAVNSAVISPLPYIPQSFGVLVGRILRLPPLFIFYLGRIFNFLAWLGLVYAAIRITPIYPRLFAALALMPMTLHQAASNSPDAATIALTFLLIAYVLRILLDQQPGICWQDWAMVALLVVGVALCKSIYILAAGLLVAVPARRFRQQPATILLTLAVLTIGLAVGLLWLNTSLQTVSEQMMNNFRTPTTAGLRYVITNPQVSVPILWRSIVMYTGDQMRMFVGILGWIDTVLPGWVYPLYFALLLGVVLLEPHTKGGLLPLERILIAGLAILSHLVILSIFFYPGISEGNGLVDLAHGRYFIPFGALYFLPFGQRKWGIAQNSRFWVLVGLLIGLVLIAAVRAMLWRYYAI